MLLVVVILTSLTVNAVIIDVYATWTDRLSGYRTVRAEGQEAKRQTEQRTDGQKDVIFVVLWLTETKGNEGNRSCTSSVVVLLLVTAVGKITFKLSNNQDFLLQEALDKPLQHASMNMHSTFFAFHHLLVFAVEKLPSDCQTIRIFFKVLGEALSHWSNGACFHVWHCMPINAFLTFSLHFITYWSQLWRNNAAISSLDFPKH